MQAGDFSRSLMATRSPLNCWVWARRAMPVGKGELATADFRVVEFRNITTHRRLVSLRAEAPHGQPGQALVH